MFFLNKTFYTFRHKYQLLCIKIKTFNCWGYIRMHIGLTHWFSLEATAEWLSGWTQIWQASEILSSDLSSFSAK